jgi:hypothetical protein
MRFNLFVAALLLCVTSHAWAQSPSHPYRDGVWQAQFRGTVRGCDPKAPAVLIVKGDTSKVCNLGDGSCSSEPYLPMSHRPLGDGVYKREGQTIGSLQVFLKYEPQRDAVVIVRTEIEDQTQAARAFGSVENARRMAANMIGNADIYCGSLPP